VEKEETGVKPEKPEKEEFGAAGWGVKATGEGEGVKATG